MSCTAEPKKQAKKKPVAAKTVKKKNTGKKAKKGAAQIAHWNNIKKKLALSDKQIAQVKVINNKYGAQVTKLKKTKKWDGAKNAKTRQSVAKNKNLELKKVLGNKYAKYLAMIKKPKKKK